eukprot:882592-Rhodomonas_salina.1
MVEKDTSAGSTETKHELSTWDSKLATFHLHHKEDATKMVSSYGVSYILAAGQALFTMFNLLREEARQEKTAFNDNPDTWTEALQVEELTKHFDDLENGKIVTRLSVVQSTVLKSTFRMTDVTNFKAAFYNSEDELKKAMTTAVEDHQRTAGWLPYIQSTDIQHLPPYIRRTIDFMLSPVYTEDIICMLKRFILSPGWPGQQKGMARPPSTFKLCPISITPTPYHSTVLPQHTRSGFQ